MKLFFKKAVSVLSALSLFLFQTFNVAFGIVPSNITPYGSTNTEVIAAPNGVTVVNIASPSGDGTSLIILTPSMFLPEVLFLRVEILI